MEPWRRTFRNQLTELLCENRQVLDGAYVARASQFCEAVAEGVAPRLRGMSPHAPEGEAEYVAAAMTARLVSTACLVMSLTLSEPEEMEATEAAVVVERAMSQFAAEAIYHPHLRAHMGLLSPIERGSVRFALDRVYMEPMQNGVAQRAYRSLTRALGLGASDGEMAA